MTFDWNFYTNKYGKRIYPTSKGKGLLLNLRIRSCVDGAFIYYSCVKRQLKDNLDCWKDEKFKSKVYLYRTNWSRPDFDFNLLRHFDRDSFKKIIHLIRLYDHRYSSKPNRALKAGSIGLRSLKCFEERCLPRIQKLIVREDQLIEENNLYKIYLYDKRLHVLIK